MSPDGWMKLPSGDGGAVYVAPGVPGANDAPNWLPGSRSVITETTHSAMPLTIVARREPDRAGRTAAAAGELSSEANVGNTEPLREERCVEAHAVERESVEVIDGETLSASAAITALPASSIAVCVPTARVCNTASRRRRRRRSCR